MAQNGIEVKATVSSAGVISSDVTAAGTTVIATITSGAPGKDGTGTGAPVTRGIGVILAGETDAIISHGLGVTPTSVLLTLADNTGGGLAEFWVSASDGTTFTATIAGSTPDDTPFYWLAVGVGGGGIGGGGGGGGTGLPGGGTTGQVLGKNSGASDDVSWQAVVNSLNGRTGNVTLSESDITGLTTDLAGKATLASPTFTGTVTLPAPVGATDAATKGYVDATAQGLSVKNSTDVLASANVVLSGLQTIDGVTMTAGQRVLLTAQTTASQNGIWVVGAGSWTRPADFSSGSLQKGSFTFIISGSVWADTGWVLSNATAATVDTTAQTWTEFSSVAGAVTLTGAQTVTGAKTFNAGAFLDNGNQVFDVRAYGVKLDGKTVSDGAITTGTPNLTSATASFVPDDVGKYISVGGALGSGNPPLVTTILAYVSATAVTLAANATATVSAQKIVWGTNEGAKWLDAFNAANTAGGGTIFSPGGISCGNGQVLRLYGNCNFVGPSKDGLTLFDMALQVFDANQLVSGFTIDSNGRSGYSAVAVRGSNKRIENVAIYNWRDFGLKLDYNVSDPSGHLEDIYVTRCLLINQLGLGVTGGSTIVTGYYNNVWLVDNEFGDNVTGMWIEALTGSDAGSGQTMGLYIIGNRVYGQYGGNPAYVTGKHLRVENNDLNFDLVISSGTHFASLGFVTDDVIVSGNTFRAKSTGGESILTINPGNSTEPLSGTISNLQIVDNHFAYGSIHVQPSANPSVINNLKIDHNTFAGSDNAEILFLSSGAALTFNNLSISDNTFAAWGQGASGGSYFGVQIESATNSITFNRSKLSNNTFSPASNTNGIRVRLDAGGSFVGTLTYNDNDVSAVTVTDDTGSTLVGRPISSPFEIRVPSGSPGPKLTLRYSAFPTNSFQLWADSNRLQFLNNTGTDTSPTWTEYLNLTNGGDLNLLKSGASLVLGATSGSTQIRRGGVGTSTDLYIGENADTGHLNIRGTGSTNIGASVSIGSGSSLTGPSQKLHVFGAAGDGIRIESSGDQPRLELKGSGGTIQIQASNNGNWLDIAVPGGASPTLRLVSDSAQLFGVASTSGSNLQNSPQFRLYGTYWNGSASTNYQADIQHVMSATTPSSRLALRLNGNEYLSLLSSGLVGVSQPSPTAWLDTPPGTTGAASLRIRSGVAPTGPNDGDMWYDGTHVKFRIGATSFQIDQQAAGSYLPLTGGTLSGDLALQANLHMTAANSVAYLGATNSGYFVIERGQVTSGSSTDLYIGENADTGHLYVRGSGSVNIGAMLSAGSGSLLTNPTAMLDAAASTTSAASLRLRAGTAPTSPNDGDLWNDSTTHHLMARLNGASYQLDQQGGSTSFATLTKFK